MNALDRNVRLHNKRLTRRGKWGAVHLQGFPPLASADEATKLLCAATGALRSWTIRKPLKRRPSTRMLRKQCYLWQINGPGKARARNHYQERAQWRNGN